MDVTYYVALPFVLADDGVAAGEAVECLSANAAVMRAEALSRKPGCAGAIAFSRTGDPATGEFSDAKLIRKFGDVRTPNGRKRAERPERGRRSQELQPAKGRLPRHFPGGRLTPWRLAADASAITRPPMPLPLRSAFDACVSVFFDGGMIRSLPPLAIFPSSPSDEG